MVPDSIHVHKTNKSQMMKILLHGQSYAITNAFRKIRCFVLFLLKSEEKELVNELDTKYIQLSWIKKLKM